MLVDALLVTFYDSHPFLQENS